MKLKVMDTTWNETNKLNTNNSTVSVFTKGYT